MTRHGRNATNSAVYTYHERQKDAKASGYGTEKARLNKDSIKGFDCCSLTLQPCRNPVVTPEGFLYDKEAILEYIMGKKKEYHRKLTAYEAQKSKEFKELQSTAQKDLQKQKEAFEKQEKDIRKASTIAAKEPKPGSSKSMPSFWVPNLTPQAEETKLKRPEKTVYCPNSGKPLKVKNLIEVKFTQINDKDDKRSLIAKEERYKCAVTNDALRNTTTVAVLKPTGHVVTESCVEKIIKKEGMLHPLTGEKLSDCDIIYLQKGGTGYSAANQQLQAEHYRPNLAIS